MDIEVVLGENQKVDALYKGFVIKTDQPEKAGGDNSAPSPFDLFLASVATCAGFYVKSFCQQRDLPEKGIRIIQKMQRDPVKKMISKVEIDIIVPDGFPEKYKHSLIKAAEACTVKKHIADAPEFVVNTR